MFKSSYKADTGSPLFFKKNSLSPKRMLSSHTNSDDDEEKNFFLEKLTNLTQKVHLFQELFAKYPERMQRQLDSRKKLSSPVKVLAQPSRLNLRQTMVIKESDPDFFEAQDQLQSGVFDPSASPNSRKL